MRLYDHDALCRTYFFPEPEAPPPAVGTGAPLRIPHPDGYGLSAWWSRPSPGAPTVLLFHGNGESVRTDLAFWPRFFTRLGVNLLLVDYPGYGASGGRPTFSSCAEGGRAALQFLLARGPDEVPGVIVMGRSMGSWVALKAVEALDSNRLLGVVIESGIADLGQRLVDRIDYESAGLEPVEVLAAVRRDFDLKAIVASLGCPILVLHARRDSLVPSWHGRLLAEWAGERLHALALFDDGDHNSILAENFEAYERVLQDFLSNLMVPDRSGPLEGADTEAPRQGAAGPSRSRV